MSERGQIGSARVDLPAVLFRRHEPGDIQACARLAQDAWPAGSAIASKMLELSGMEPYVEYSLSLANWTDIAYTSDGVVGFLFGRIDNYLGAPLPRKTWLGEFPVIIRSFFEYGSMTLELLRLLWSLILAELKLRLKTPKSDASIEMLIVDSRFRERGIGSELINRFLNAARAAGSSLVTVRTDERMSNWQFYEKRGFRRVATFYDNITSRYSVSDVRGIIFALDLRKGKLESGGGNA